MGKKKPITDHLGNEFDSIASMCKYWGVSQRLYSDRKNRRFTEKQALGLEKRPRKRKETNEELYNRYGISQAQLKMLLDSGFSKAEIKKINPNRLHTDHLGNIYKSFNKMCEAYKIKDTTVRNRLKLGWDLKTALTKDVNNRGNKDKHKDDKE